MAYLWLQAIHVIAVIAWMAGLLYLYRLFVYHRAERHEVVRERFCMMERRLWFIITVPAAWLALSAGFGMVFLRYCWLLSQGWFTLKLFIVLLLLGLHLLAGRCRRKFLHPPYPFTTRTFRLLNEGPTLCMILIVLLVVLQPPLGVWSICA